MTTPSDRPFRIARLLQVVRHETGGSFDKAALLQTVGALSEAFSVALLIPMLRLMGRENNALAFTAAGRHFTITLPVILAALVVLIALRALAMQRKEALSARVTFGFVETMTSRLFSALANTRWSVVNQWRTADMAHVLIGNGDRLLQAIMLLMVLVQSIAMAVVLTLLSFALSWQMTLVALGVGALLLLATFPLRGQSLRQGRELAEARREQHRITDEFLNGLRTAKAFGLEAQHVEAMNRVLARIRDGHMQFTAMRGATATVHQIATALALAVFVYFALSIAGLPLEKTVALLFLYMRLAPRMVMLYTTSQELMAQIGTVESVLTMLDTAEANAEQPAKTDMPPLRPVRDIVIRDVQFVYDAAAAPALQGVSAEIPVGKITAVVGPTGSGKSTLVDVLLGLIRPQHGSVLVDGVTLSDDVLQSWQASVGYVPQDTFLFNGTIASNLRLASPTASDAELWQALDAADARELVLSLPDTLDHAVGDRGRSLSGGERQRLAIARALVRGPGLLILDEATSALDASSQRRVAESLRRLCAGGMTVVAIAHRLSMLAFADHVIVLENARVVESGPLERILARPESVIREMIDADGRSEYTRP